ncbi:hypothetical protein [Staphylococcus phage SA3]|nr:hypothetical protein [Staphylococcus phage SA3]
MIKIDMLNVTNEEHENCINELMDLNNSFESYYIDDNALIPIYDNEELLNAYEYITTEFYFDINDITNYDIEYLNDYVRTV